ncbi:hypothetical protein CEP51_015083 [Fusarium floridanum]|uniref:Uncharacterized protein n=1 Tax=Fusarium floridanum TaxID=1325733 RepID=A0A428PGX1_9HYPO|nr:hypothetical protein CEP51_015083 [Fusarium floridanum]
MRVGRTPDLEPRTVSGLPCPRVWALHAPLIRKTPIVDLIWGLMGDDLQTLAALDLDLMDGDLRILVVPDLTDGGLQTPEVPGPMAGDPLIPGPVATDPHRQVMAHRLLGLMAITGQAPMAHRKPVPERAPTFEAPAFEEPKASTMSTSSVVTANDIIDHYAFDQGRRPVGTPTSDRRPPPPQRQGSNRSGQSSHYDDSSSVNSIDYASTHKSTETKKSVERPRAGVLKTVGGSDEPEMPRDAGYDIPDINFGPTINYGATQQHSRAPSALTPGSDPAQRPYSPADQRPTPPAHKSSGSHGRKDSEDMKRTMAWQPGASAASSGSQGLSAEQFVQQRAAHARSASSNTLSGGRPTTPGGSMKRTSSYDMLQGLQGGSGRHSRNSSADMLSRPGSRGANSALNFASPGDAPSHLSAREQEQVARLTGAPLISMPGHQRQGSQGSAMLGHQRQASSGSGLVAAIEAREREKQQMKQGMSSQAVQQAINQRQQQQAAMAYQQQVTQQHQQQLAQQQMAQQQMAQQQMAQQQMMQQQLAQQQQMAQQQAAYQQQAYQQQQQQQQMGGAYSTMGQGGGQYGAGGMPYGGPQQQAGGYGQPASFSRPLRTPQPVDPRFVPPQGQYGPAPGSQQAPRNVHPQYQGQAF